MIRLRQARLWLRVFFRRGRVESELSQEIENHLELEIRKNVDAGMDPATARRKAMVDFGGVIQLEAARFGSPAEDAYKMDADRPFVAGSFIWSGFDYIGEPTPYYYFPSKSSYFGIVDTAGFPKDIYYFYKSVWTAEPLVHILPHWNWSQGETITVFVYHNCDSVELFQDEISKGSQTFAPDKLHAEWELAWAPGALRAECTKNSSVVAEDVVETAGEPVLVLLSADRTTIKADGLDLAFITGDILDADGIFVPTAETPVAFSVSGPGEIIGVDNGNPRDASPFKVTSRDAFSGKVLAIVRSTGTPGEIVVTASSAGLAPGSVAITAE